MDAQAQAAIAGLRDAAGRAGAAVEGRRATFAALGSIASAIGMDPRIAAGPLLERATVADSVWSRITNAIAQLSSGAAVLLNGAGRWIVVPRSLVPAGGTLSGWEIYVLAAPFGVAGIAGALVADFGLEMNAAAEQNERLRLDALARAQQLVTSACSSGNPEMCRRATEAYQAVAGQMRPPEGSGQSWYDRLFGAIGAPAAAAAGGVSLALIGILALMFFGSGGFSRKRNPRRRRRRR